MHGITRYIACESVASLLSEYWRMDVALDRRDLTVQSGIGDPQAPQLGLQDYMVLLGVEDRGGVPNSMLAGHSMSLPRRWESISSRVDRLLTRWMNY